MMNSKTLHKIQKFQFGPGHASFTLSPDSAECWIVYHAKKDTMPGWGNRYVNMKRFMWSKNGTPNFGEPVSPDKEIPLPTGRYFYQSK